MVSAIVPNPTHPVVLTDQSGNAYGLMLCGPRGENDIEAISRTPFPRTGLKISSQETKYSDEELPYASTNQDDFSGGRGAEKFEDDKTRFADSYRCETRFPNIVFPGAQEHYCTGVGATIHLDRWADSATRSHTNASLDGGYLATKFTATATSTIWAVLLMMDTMTALTQAVTVEIYSNLAGHPNLSLGTVGVIATGNDQHGIYPYLVQNTSAGVAVTSGTVYWVVIHSTGAFSLVEDGAFASTTFMYSADGAAWSAGAGDLYARVYGAITEANTEFFWFRGGWYAIHAGSLYISGDRGVADASAATTLVDATKSGTSIPWVANEFTGAVVYILRGTGAGQYRTIASNTTTVLTISEAWTTTPNTTSEYVILGASKWRLVLSSGNYTAYAVAGEILYLAEGTVSYYNNYNAGGTYTERNSNIATLAATKLLATYDSGERKWILWGADNTDSFHGSAIWKMTVPPLWGAVFNNKGTVYRFSEPWDDYVAANVSIAKGPYDDSMEIAVAAGFATGLLAVKNIAPINLTSGRYFEFAIKSSVATAGANDLYLVYCSDELAPNSLIAAPNVSGRQRPPDTVYKRDVTPTYTDLTAARDARSGFGSTVTITSADAILVGSTRPFNAIYVNMGATVNAVASALTASYMSSSNGLFTALSNVTDGTANPAGTPLAQDGIIAFTAPADWQPFEINGETLYWVSLFYATNLTANIVIFELTVWLSATLVAIPDLAIDTWTWVRMSATLLARPFPDDSAIASIGLYLATDLGAQTIDLRDSIYITDYVEEYISVQTKSRVTNLVAYGSDTLNPFIISEGEIFEVQTQNSDSIVKVPLEELGVLATPDTGMAVCTNDVYMYFSMGKRVQRYHDGLLENLGPDQDNGLPSGRSGLVTSLTSLPGGSIAAVVQGSEQHSVLVRKTGWHESYRTPIRVSYTGAASSLAPTKIGGASVQEIPGVGVVMWISQGGMILKMKFPMSESEAGSDYLYGSSVITPWVSMGFLDVQKRLMLLKLYTEGLALQVPWIYAFYQTESGTFKTGWTALAPFNTSPFDTSVVSSTYSVSARRFRIKFLFYNLTYTDLAKLRAWIIGVLLTLDVRYMYTLRVRLDDDPEDLAGHKDYTKRAETLQAVLDGFAASPPTVLTMTSLFSTMGGLPGTGKTVIVMPYPFKPYNIITQDGKEAHVADIQLLEVA